MSSPETDAAIAGARATQQRLHEERLAPFASPSRRRTERTQSLGRRMTRIAVADAAILMLAVVIGLVTPLGILGAMGVMILLLAATVLFAVWPAERPVQAEALRSADLATLPRQTERWLEAQRPALPAPAITLVDRIGQRLAALEPQLVGLTPHAPAAEDVRKLVGEQLPDFIRDYQRVPASLRSVERNGRTPDAQLVDGLTLIDRQIAEMSETLAQGDLDTLATRGRYLEIKYQGEGTAG
jgi:hypothetical protein